MTIISAHVLPHGAVVLKPSNEQETNLADAMKKVGDQLERLKPDILFVSTPHGYMLKHNYAIYLTTKAFGSAEWEGEYQEYALDAKIDLQLAESLVTHLSSQEFPIEGIIPHIPTLPVELRWGEVVPLWYLPKGQKHLFFSFPARRYDHPERMKDEIETLGKKMFEWLEDLEQNISVIISGDWAHTHAENGPYGFSLASKTFDLAIVRWLQYQSYRNEEWENALQTAMDTVNDALSCGFTGLFLLNALVDQHWNGDLLAYEAPSYYGMAVASYFPAETLGETLHETYIGQNQLNSSKPRSYKNFNNGSIQ